MAHPHTLNHSAYHTNTHHSKRDILTTGLLRTPLVAPDFAFTAATAIQTETRNAFVLAPHKMSALDETDISSSTPIKDTSRPPVYSKSDMSESVTDLLQAIDKNISSASLDHCEDDSTNNLSMNISDEVKPLNLRPLTNTVSEEQVSSTDSGPVMETIPKAPSFDELEFNTRLNRASSISRLTGPRQLANSSLSRTFSNKMGRSSSFRSSAPNTRDNSPSKKSVCFEDSPPKIVEYDEFTPENSDNSLEEQHEDTFDLNWNGKLKASEHPLPPPPPRHLVLSPSPQKDTTLGSSDDDSQDFNLTKEELQNNTKTLEERLDLVLGSDDVSNRVQQDEVNRGSGSPLRSMTQKEEDLLLSIKKREEIAEEKYLRDASQLFEQDLRNSDRSSKVLRLDPVLRRKNSNNSLRDEERELSTKIVAETQGPITIKGGLKNADLDHLPAPDDLASVAESTVDSFASATDIFDSEPIIVTTIKKESTSSNSISTLNGEDDQEQVKMHKKKISISESINSFIASFGKSPKKGEDVKIKQEVPGPDTVPGSLLYNSVDVESLIQSHAIDDVAAPGKTINSKELLPSVEIEVTHNAEEYPNSAVVDPMSGNKASALEHVYSHASEDNQVSVVEIDDDVYSIQSSIDGDLSHHSKVVSPVEHQSLLGNSSPLLEADVSNPLSDDLLLPRPPLLDEGHIDADSSFVDEFKETMLYNSSDRLNESYRSTPNDEVAGTENVLGDLDGVTGDTAVSIKQEDHVVSIPTQTQIHERPSSDADSECKNSRMLKSPQDASTATFAADNVASTAVQAEPVEVEVGVQTDDLDFGDDFKTLKPSFKSRAEFESDDEHERPTGAIPSFNSTLFHDKVPVEPESSSVPATNYIDIWHSLPKPLSPQPQYGAGFGAKALSPTESVLRRLSTRRSKKDHREKITLDATQLKEEDLSDRKRLSLVLDDSFVATSVGQSSFVNVGSRNTSMNLDSSGIALPDISNSSDFGTAFKDWEVSRVESGNRSVKAEDMKQDANVADHIRTIWGVNEPTPVMESHQSRTPSVDAGKIENMIATTKVEGEQVHVKSSNAIGEVVVTKQEDPGVEIEYDTSECKPSTIAEPAVLASPQSKSIVSPFSMRVKSVTPRAPEVHEEHAYAGTRLISGMSVRSERPEFDLNAEFEKAMNLRVPSSSSTFQRTMSADFKPEIVSSNDVLNEAELSKPMVPEVDNLSYMKTRSKKDAQSPQKPQGPRVRTPLAALAGSELNQLDSRKSSLNTQRVVSQPLSENYQVGDSMLKKRESRMSMFHDASNEATDKGRLYIHINSLNEILLDNIKTHMATFKLYLDNGKHTIATPKMKLTNNTVVDKEFEVIVDEDATDLHFIFKITYQRPENELVEVYEKIPLKNNRLSRIIGGKPKYRVQKSFETRKVVVDSWDNKFANDGSFGKNKISFFTNDNEVTGKTQNYVIELFNEWETQTQNGKEYKKAPHLIGKMDVTMLYIPRTSSLETLPPTINIAQNVANHIVEQSRVRYEGFLFQEGGDCDLWKRRFFKVEGTKLIAHHETTRKPRAQINLLKVVDIVHNGKKKVEGQRNFTDEILMNDGFKLKFKNGEIITFNAETDESKRAWIDVLEAVVGQNKFHQPWVKLLAQKEIGTLVR